MTPTHHQAREMRPSYQDLLDENEALRFELNEIRGDSQYLQLIPYVRAFGATRWGEARILHHLASVNFASKDALFNVLYGNKPDADVPENAKRVVEIHICRLRKKLKLDGIKIFTIWGQGWKISEEDKVKITKILNQHRGQA